MKDRNTYTHTKSYKRACALHCVCRLCMEDTKYTAVKMHKLKNEWAFSCAFIVCSTRLLFCYCFFLTELCRKIALHSANYLMHIYDYDRSTNKVNNKRVSHCEDMFILHA